jgi:hypothetical protein
MSYLIAQRLQRLDRRVAIIYFMDLDDLIKNDKVPFISEVLSKIYFQLSQKKEKAFFSNSLAEIDEAVSKIKLRDLICTLLKESDHLFLIVDDLHRCGYQKAQELEIELSYLQSRGLRIMVSSCVPQPRLWSRFRVWNCDVCPATLIEEYDVWVCHTCFHEVCKEHEKERFEKLNDTFIVCECSQKAGKTATICDR